jgi:hypothetical protein
MERSGIGGVALHLELHDTAGHPEPYAAEQRRGWDCRSSSGCPGSLAKKGDRWIPRGTGSLGTKGQTNFAKNTTPLGWSGHVDMDRGFKF